MRKLPFWRVEILSTRGTLMEEDFFKIAIEVRAYIINRENSRKNYSRGTK